jgi:glucose-6-phosphate 1-dehydrogenase
MADHYSAQATIKPLTVADDSSHKPKSADPCAMVLFGATGDLAKRLVVPALYNLSCSGVLPEDFALIGVARSENNVEGWRASLRAAMEGFVAAKSGTFNADHIDEAAWKRLCDRMSFVQGEIADPKLYEDLHGALSRAKSDHGTLGNAIFYLAVASRLFAPAVEQLGKARLLDQAEGEGESGRTWRRVVIEKPFGHSLESARALSADTRKTLAEDQVSRTDHFLGKDTVQSIMAFRFANGMFEPIWNRDRIDHVQFTAAETVGVEKRGEFYEHTGALRDMVSSHVLSLVSLVAMEPPAGFDAASVRARKAEVLAAIPAAKASDAVRGQYGAGEFAGAPLQPNRQEPGVSADSDVETNAALKFEIDNWRWSGVHFYVRTGKHLAARMTEIAIRFKQAPHSMFQETPVEALKPNWLVIRIAPDESISLQFEVKRRGPVMDLSAVKMEFQYGDWFPKAANVGYETLLYDVMIGDPTLFMRDDMVEHGWRILQPVLDAWAKDRPQFPNYASGSEGPRGADALIAAEGGRTWRPIGGSAGKSS